MCKTLPPRRARSSSRAATEVRPHPAVSTNSNPGTLAWPPASDLARSPTARRAAREEPGKRLRRGSLAHPAILPCAGALAACCLLGLTGRLDSVTAAATALGLGPVLASLWPALTRLRIAEREALQRAAGAERDAEALRSANRELEDFVRSVSHDLKAPLVTTTGFLAMAQSDLASGNAAGAADLIDRTAASASRMDRMISDLLELSRAGETARSSSAVGLDEEVDQVLQDFAPRLGLECAEITVRGPLGWVAGDAVRVRQVVANLVSNALKYGGRDGGVRVEIWTEASDDGVQLLVADHGTGIPRPDRERIFELFERLPRDAAGPVEGTGVGLAIVRRAMEAMGGSVALRMTAGGGATFALHFAAIEAAAIAA